MVVGQNTIVFLYGDLLGARVNMLTWRNGTGAGILRPYNNLAHVLLGPLVCP